MDGGGLFDKLTLLLTTIAQNAFRAKLMPAGTEVLCLRMSWFKRVLGALGGGEPPEVGTKLPPPEVSAPAPKPTASSSPQIKRTISIKRDKGKTYTPTSVARMFAQFVPGAVLEDFADAHRDDAVLARVTYGHQGVIARVVIYQYDDVTLTAWIETKCTGIFGAFDVCRACPDDESDAEDDARSGAAADGETPTREARFYFTRECYVSGERLRNEVARIRTLPQNVQDRLVEATRNVELIKLSEEVISACIGDIFQFIDVIESQGGASSLLALGSELAYLGKQLPSITKDVAELFEARTCRFCKASFVFSPDAPSCTGCGAPAETADPMPELAPIEIADDPIDEDGIDDPEYLDEKMEGIRALVVALLPLVDEPRVREDRERARIFVEYKLDGRSFRVKIMEESVGIGMTAPGVRGHFNLGWGENDLGGEKDPANVWRESDRKIFFSRHLRVGSPRTTKEAARLASLPAAALALLTSLGEEDQAAIQLEDGFLGMGLGHAAHERGIELVLSRSRDLAKLADAFPRDFDDEDLRYRLKACAYCGWAYFCEVAQQSCSHCGGPSQ